MARRNNINIWFAHHQNLVLTILIVLIILTNTFLLLVLEKGYSKKLDLLNSEFEVKLAASQHVSDSLATDGKAANFDNQPEFNVYYLDYSVADLNQKRAINLNRSIYFLGEITPMGKLITATPYRFICLAGENPLTYNICYKQFLTPSADSPKGENNEVE